MVLHWFWVGRGGSLSSLNPLNLSEEGVSVLPSLSLVRFPFLPVDFLALVLGFFFFFLFVFH